MLKLDMMTNNQTNVDNNLPVNLIGTKMMDIDNQEVSDIGSITKNERISTGNMVTQTIKSAIFDLPN